MRSGGKDVGSVPLLRHTICLLEQENSRLGSTCQGLRTLNKVFSDIINTPVEPDLKPLQNRLHSLHQDLAEQVARVLT
jgi:hypothetical protein